VISAKNIVEDGYLPVMATQPGTRPSKLAAPRPGVPVYLSPMDEQDETINAANRRAVAQLAIRYNVIAGIQLHKFMEMD
jgi:hypothetical protein